MSEKNGYAARGNAAFFSGLYRYRSSGIPRTGGALKEPPETYCQPNRLSAADRRFYRYEVGRGEIPTGLLG
ncbi:hypothetical protein D3C76_1808160 [compost metagenome]